ncbi:MAG TPA: AsmA family protein, partial [Vineibacter sp.]|nr:AsmA family protein [Vineibacter sp.]
MKKILIGVGIVVGLLVVAVIAAPFLIDPNVFKPQIIAKAKESTNRELVIDGPLTLSILPTPTVSAEGVRFANAPGGKAPQIIELKAVRAGVSLLPLLSGRVRVGELRLVEPKIALEVGPDGRANYDFQRSSGPSQTAPSASSPPTSTTANADDGFGAFAVDRVVIENGTLTYSDARANREYRLEKMALTLSAGTLKGPFSASG